VRRFYDDHFVGHWPEDVVITQVSHSLGTDPVVDEMVRHFTHDRVMDTSLPGVALTGRPVRLPVVVVAGFEDGKVAYERIYWDRASLLLQGGPWTPQTCRRAGMSKPPSSSSRTARATSSSPGPRTDPNPPVEEGESPCHRDSIT